VHLLKDIPNIDWQLPISRICAFEFSRQARVIEAIRYISVQEFFSMPDKNKIPLTVSKNNFLRQCNQLYSRT